MHYHTSINQWNENQRNHFIYLCAAYKVLKKIIISLAVTIHVIELRVNVVPYMLRIEFESIQGTTNHYVEFPRVQNSFS